MNKHIGQWGLIMLIHNYHELIPTHLFLFLRLVSEYIVVFSNVLIGINN